MKKIQNYVFDNIEKGPHRFAIPPESRLLTLDYCMNRLTLSVEATDKENEQRSYYLLVEGNEIQENWQYITSVTGEGMRIHLYEDTTKTFDRHERDLVSFANYMLKRAKDFADNRETRESEEMTGVTDADLQNWYNERM